MRKRAYAAGLGLLPIAYVGLMLMTGQPIDWSVIGLMALIVFPAILLAISGAKSAKAEQEGAGADEEESRAEGGQGGAQGAQAPTSRLVGLAMLAAAILSLAANFALAKIAGLYFPLMLVPAGPLATMGALAAANPRFLDAMFAKRSSRGGWAFKMASYASLALGLLIGMLAWAALRGD